MTMGRLYEEPWFDCDICGFSFPVSKGQRHFRTKRLVDRECADEKSWSDYRERQTPREERLRTSPQPVKDQGSVTSAGFGQ